MSRIQVCSDIVQLSVVNPMGSYSHGYIGAKGKKEDTYYKQGCMSQITYIIYSNSAPLVIRPGLLSTLCTYCYNSSVAMMSHSNALCKSFGIQRKPTRVLKTKTKKPRSESYTRVQHHTIMVMLDLLTYNGPVSSFQWQSPPLCHALDHLLFCTPTCLMQLAINDRELLFGPLSCSSA